MPTHSQRANRELDETTAWHLVQPNHKLVFGLRISLGETLSQGRNDNQNNDAFFGSVKFVVKLGDNGDKKKQNFLEYTDVSDKLYQPVKRENKIRVVKISKSGVTVGGF